MHVPLSILGFAVILLTGYILIFSIALKYLATYSTGNDHFVIVDGIALQFAFTKSELIPVGATAVVKKLPV